MIVGRPCETAELTASDETLSKLLSCLTGPQRQVISWTFFDAESFRGSEAQPKKTGLGRLNAGRSHRMPTKSRGGCSIRNTGSSNTLAMKYRQSSGLRRAREPGGCKVVRMPS